MNKQTRIFIVFLFSAAIPIFLSFWLLQTFGQPTWVNEPLHSSIEAAGSLVAIVLGGLLLAQRHYEDSSTDLVWIASALFSMGILDGFHALLHVNASFFWTRAFATFLGGLLYVLVWLPESKLRGKWLVKFPWFVIFFSLVLGGLLDLFPASLPQLFDARGAFTWNARLINMIGGIGYLIAVPQFLREKNDQPRTENFIFASQCLMLGIAGLLFALSNMWSPVWWLFHFMRFASYIIILWYVFASYTKVQKRMLEANQILQQRNGELAASNQELEAFCYSVSHDLRAPLRGIDGFSLALLEDYEAILDNEGKKYITYIRDGVQRMGQLIDDLLMLSRVTRSEIEVQPVDISALAEEVGRKLQESEPDRRVEFLVQEGLTTYADKGLLKVCLENLLGNAWKFTGKKTNPKVEFGSKQVSGKTVFFIEDNGAGFDMAYADKLFGAFQRLHTGAEFPGSGIGLATVKRIINRHGGQIWPKSTAGQGAEFCFTLPKPNV